MKKISNFTQTYQGTPEWSPGSDCKSRDFLIDAFIKDQNKKVGISLKPKSKIDLLKDYLNQIDLVLIMSVEPGFGGQKFIKGMLQKIKECKELISSTSNEVQIEVDGGIDLKNIKS